MSPSERGRIEAAAQRLRGNLVATPIVGEPFLPAQGAGRALRLKLEVLQLGGSAWFRGAMHALGRRLGSLPKVRVVGEVDIAFAVATAARLQRIACEVQGPFDARTLEGLRDLGAQIATRGDVPALDLNDPDFRDGLATLGLELAQQLPLDVEQVHVDRRLAGEVGRGLRSGGRELQIVATDAVQGAELRRLRRLAARGLGVMLRGSGAGALASALRVQAAVVAAVV